MRHSFFTHLRTGLELVTAAGTALHGFTDTLDCALPGSRIMPCNLGPRKHDVNSRLCAALILVEPHLAVIH